MSASIGLRVETRPDVTCGGTVRGVRLAELDEATFRGVYRLWLEHKLLVFPDQRLTREQQIAFTRRFGEIEIELAELSNIRADGSIASDPKTDFTLRRLLGSRFWHCDSTYMPVQAKGGVLSAQVVPSEGGQTEWADLTAAYEALDPPTQVRLESLSAYHSLSYSMAKADAPLAGAGVRDAQVYDGYGSDVREPSLRPLVKRHPETGRRSLNIGRHAYGVVGLSEGQSEALLNGLTEFACQPPRVYTHDWQVGDVVVFDNRCLAHRVRPWKAGDARVLFNSRIAGDPATESALAA
jgi:alpha-ketoglutarate-dependent taurine dioxygenase